MSRNLRQLEDLSETSVPFPRKLYELLSRENGPIIEWVPHGFAFKVNEQDAFMRDIVPNYFKHTKLTSFQRQLNLYGFRRLTKGDDVGAYFHPKFQRNKPELVEKITRLPQKAALETLEEVMNASKAPAARSQIPRKRSLNSWVTPLKDNSSRAPAVKVTPAPSARATMAGLSASDGSSYSGESSKRQRKAAVDYDEGLGHYRTRRIAQLEQSVLGAVSVDELDDGGSATSANHANAVVTPNPNPYAVGSLGLRLQIPSEAGYHLRHGWPYHNAQSAPTHQFVFSPGGRSTTDDFNELFPDLIGSPRFGGMTMDFDRLLQSPTGFGFSLLNTPMAQGFRMQQAHPQGAPPAAQGPLQAQASSSAVQPALQIVPYAAPASAPHLPPARPQAPPPGTGVPRDALVYALQQAVASAAHDPNRISGISASGVRSYGPPNEARVSFVAPPSITTATSSATAVPTDASAAAPTAAAAAAAAASVGRTTDSYGTGGDGSATTAAPSAVMPTGEHEVDWLSGQTAEAFDEFLDSYMLCPTPTAAQGLSAGTSGPVPMAVTQGMHGAHGMQGMHGRHGKGKVLSYSK